MQVREKQRRKVLIAFAAIVGGAIVAFVVTMSMTTSYPSQPEPPSVARPAVALPGDVRAPTPARDVVVAASPGDGAADGAQERAPSTDAGAAASTVASKSARGGILADDGAAPRSTGNLGTLAKDDVKAGVAAVKDKVEACYERALAIDPELAGTLKVSFTLEGNDEGKGVVTKGEIPDSDMHSPFFEACVLKEIAAAEFKAPGGGGVVNVTYPFHFTSEDDDAGP